MNDASKEEDLVKNFFNLQIYNLFEQLYLNLVTLFNDAVSETVHKASNN